MANTGQVVELEGNSPKEKTPSAWQKYWEKQKSAADKRMRIFTRRGNEVVRRFVDERQGGGEGVQLENGNRPLFAINLFNTNITTLQSMLYGQDPKIDVSREHHDPDDDVARVAAVLYERMLSADTNGPAADVKTALKASLQDRLLPGIGTCRVRYEFESSTAMEMQINGEGFEVEVEVESLDWEASPIDYVHWQDFLWGWGRTWAEVPWVGFRSWLTKEEAKERFGDKKAKNLTYVNQLPTGTAQESDVQEPDQKNNVQKAEIWEFWDKGTKKVFWYSKDTDLILDAQDDPLELEGFWPCAEPMTANLTTTLYMPTADYILAQDLYNQVDILQTRIAMITQAIKVVGVYDQSAGSSVGRMLKEGIENDLIPVDNWAMFADKGGLKGSIDWFPVESVVNTLSTLRQLLGETIELLYQVTGMSDILRGANTDQYTSDGTNQLKAKFGSIRVQALQDEFAQFCSDMEALKSEIISKHYSPESILKQSSAQFLPEPDKDKIMPAIQLMQSPDIKWRVDIRPESISMLDYAQIKQERSEFLTAMATYIQSAGPMIQAVPDSMPILLEFLKFAMAGFKGANYMEGILDQAIDMAKKQPPPKDDGADQAKELEGMRQQAEMQKIQAKSQADMQLTQMKLQGEMQKLQMDSQSNVQEIAAKSQADLEKIATDLRADLQVIAAKLNSDVTVEQTQATMQDAENAAAHQYNLTEEEQQHINTMREQRQSFAQDVTKSAMDEDGDDA